MDVVVKLNSSRGGRDKIFRTLQYGLRAVNSQPYLASNESKDLETTLASFRKLLRLGTFIDVLHGARQTIHHPDVFTRLTLTLSRIANALFLLGDHVIWLHKNKLISLKDVKSWEKFSQQAWLYSIIINLIRDYKALKASKNAAASKALVLDSVKNMADFWLPMTSLGHVAASPVFVGVMGVISSILAAVPLVDPSYKF
jgi:peroxin-11B